MVFQVFILLEYSWILGQAWLLKSRLAKRSKGGRNYSARMREFHRHAAKIDKAALMFSFVAFPIVVIVYAMVANAS